MSHKQPAAPDLVQPDRGQAATTIRLLDKAGLERWLKTLTPAQRAMVEAQKFEANGYQHAIVPEGERWSVVSGVANVASLSSWCMAKLAEVLPPGTYRLAEGQPGKAAYGWITGQYRFDRYKAAPMPRRARASCCPANPRRCPPYSPKPRRSRRCATWSTPPPRTWAPPR